MKRIFFSVLVVLLVACCSAKDYKISGKAENDNLEGITLNLKTFSGSDWQDLDKTQINNGQFSFTGSVDKPVIAMLSFSDAQKGLRGDAIFILENAKINVDIDKNQQVKVTGTRQNDILESFGEELNSVASPELVDSIQSGLLSQSEIMQRFEVLTEKSSKIIYDFSKKNINTLAGTAVFMNTHSSLSTEQKAELIELLNDETKEIPQVQSIIAQTEKERKFAPGSPYIDFELPDPNGKSFALSQLVGKHDYILIDFWASWCGPCLRTFPELTQFYEETKGPKFEILGVSLDNNEQNWKAAIEKHNLSWKHVSDLKGWQSAAGQLYAVSSIPCTFLIDREGKIVGRNLSLNKIKEILAEK